jgi:hypothetical protein
LEICRQDFSLVNLYCFNQLNYHDLFYCLLLTNAAKFVLWWPYELKIENRHMHPL